MPSHNVVDRSILKGKSIDIFRESVKSPQTAISFFLALTFSLYSYDDSENNQILGKFDRRSFRESEEDYPLSQEYLGEIEFKVLDLETAGDSTVEG